MTEIIYYAASSLDGYIATPDGSVEWLSPFESSPEDYGYADFYASVDAVLMGSRTYEQLLTFGDWPYAEKPVWVFSRRQLPTPDADITVTDVAPAWVIAELRERGIERAWLVGGGALAGAFQTADLITEYIISLMPVLLGDGVPLLGAAGIEQSLRLVETTPYQDGVTQLRYRPVTGE